MAIVSEEVGQAVRLEHRLTEIESALRTSNEIIKGLLDRETDRNGRITKLERFQTQLLTLGITASFMSPLIFGLVFFGLERVFNT